MVEPGPDKRLAPRFTVSLDVDVEFGGAHHTARSGDLSTGGMSIEMNAPQLRDGDVVRLTFYLPAKREPIVIDSEIRWRGEGCIGVRFSSLRARDMWAITKLLGAAPNMASGRK